MAAKTECAVVAVFETLKDAESAVAELAASGFQSSNIHGPAASADRPSSHGVTSVGAGSHHAGGIRAWFKAIFGTDEHADLNRYETASASGNAVVTVDVRDSDVDKASSILERFSPINLHADDFGAAEGVSTSNTNNAGYQGSPSDLYNAIDELGLPTPTKVGAGASGTETLPEELLVSRKGRAQAPLASGTGIRVYRRDNQELD